MRRPGEAAGASRMGPLTTADSVPITREPFPLYIRCFVVSRIGHFPMSENPQHFRTYLLPVLDEIRAGTR